jgi:hypothetical protein
MFVGHYAAALAAKAAEPRAPMWTLVAGCQLVDIGWGVLIAAGVERGEVDPSLPGSNLVLSHMPWTHSLPAALVWAAAAGIAGKYLLRLPGRAALIIALAVFSHWALDLIVHRPDLDLYPGGPKLGFALWDLEVVEQAVEIGLIALAAVAWTASRNRLGQAAWPVAAFVGFLVALQIAVMFLGPSAAGPLDLSAGLSAVAVYLVVTLVALPLDGKRRESPQI